MVKRSIGIDIGSFYLCAVQLSRSGDEFCIENMFIAPTRRSTDSVTEVIGSLTARHGFDRRADVAIAMPHNAVFFRNIETDSVGPKQICRLDKSALEHDFPIQPDQIVAQMCSYRQLSDEKYSVLVAATTKTLLKERLNYLIETRMRPALADAAIFAVYSAATVNHPEIMTDSAVIAYIDESYLTLAITQDGNFLIIRNIPFIASSDGNAESFSASPDRVSGQVAGILARETEITWQKTFSGQIEKDIKIYLAATGKLAEGFEAAVEEKLQCRIITINPCAQVKNLCEHNTDAPICVAEGLALRALMPDETIGINFLDADNADVKPALDIKKELKVVVSLVAAIAVISLAGLFMRLAHLETEYAHFKKEIREISQSAMPEETNIVDPLIQLDQKLKALHRYYTPLGSSAGIGFGPLEVLYTVTTNIPSGANVSIDDMLITTESVRLTANCPSFESVYAWQRLLQKIPQFSSVDVQDIQRASESESVRFTVLISLTALEQK